MKSVLINETVPDDGAKRSLEGRLQELLSGLDVEHHVRLDGYPKVTLDGPDAEAAANYLATELDTVPRELREGDVVKARLVDPGDVGFGIFARVGWDDALIPLHALRDLGDGSVRDIANRYALVDGLPVQIRVTETGDDLEAELADQEKTSLRNRRDVGAVVAIGATRSRLKRALRDVGAADKIIKVQKLGLSEQVVLCGDRTDPPGLISRIGPYLDGVKLHAVTTQ